jgi:hypothetical protein
MPYSLVGRDAGCGELDLIFVAGSIADLVRGIMVRGSRSAFSKLRRRSTASRIAGCRKMQRLVGSRTGAVAP